MGVFELAFCLGVYFDRPLFDWHCSEAKINFMLRACLWVNKLWYLPLRHLRTELLITPAISEMLNLQELFPETKAITSLVYQIARDNSPGCHDSYGQQVEEVTCKPAGKERRCDTIRNEKWVRGWMKGWVRYLTFSRSDSLRMVLASNATGCHGSGDGGRQKSSSFMHAI